MRKDYSVHNYTVLKTGYTRAKEQILRPRFIKMLCDIARSVVEAVDSAFSPLPPYESRDAGNNNFPVWRGHLHDATGVAVYDDGKLIKYLPTKKAIKKQKEGSIKKIIGSEWLRNAMEAGVAQFGEGLWIVLFCAVPYAERVNYIGSPWGRGEGFFDKFAEEMLQSILFGVSHKVY
ncbi:MAG: hypothetical protein HDS14_00495 [Bacteroides sp.]|nr:hypothetical protein [Bacteroides sp.]